MPRATEESRRIAADCWNDTRVAHKLMDDGLAEVFAEVIEDYRISIEAHREDSRVLRALEEAGVDNWEGHGYAMELLRE